MAYLELVDEEYVAKEREERTPEPVAAAVEADEVEPEAERRCQTSRRGLTPRRDADASDAGADESADEGDDSPGDADESERLDEARPEEPPADPRQPDQLERDHDDRGRRSRAW